MRAKNAKTWIQISIGLQAISILYFFFQIYMEGKVMDYEATRQDLLVFGIVSMIYGLIALGVFIGTAITFIQWFRRAYYNLHLLFSGLRYSEGWAAGAWFVPIFNWFGPYQIAEDLFKKTESKLLEHELISTNPQRFKRVGIWWGLWVASAVIGIFKVGGDDEISKIYFDIVSAIIAVGAGFVLLKVIDSYHKMEQKLGEIEDVNVTRDLGQSDLLDS